MQASKPGKALRIVLALVFVLLTLPVFPMVGFKIAGMSWLVYTDLFLRAIPLYVAWRIDYAYYDANELSPQLLPLWVALTAVMLWPLVTIASSPKVWESAAFRRVVWGYSGAVFLGTLAAASWIFSHTGVFF